MSAVCASRLVKGFGATVAVDDVSLSLAAGEVHGLLGPNGAGKTTLLRLLLGLIGPDSGDVRLLGRPLGGPGSAALDHVAGFVEDPAFYPYLSGRANLEVLAALDGGPRRRRARAAVVAEALERVGLEERGDTRVGGYSTGMRQRLGIAAALLREPRVLLLDEPTSGLDPQGARAVAALLGELAGDGVAVLLSSHQVGELEKVCDAYSFMSRGRLAWSGDAAALLAAAPPAAYALATSDDAGASRVIDAAPDVTVGDGARGALTLSATGAALDAVVLALGAQGIAVRRLEQLQSPLESMFFAVAGSDGTGVGAAGGARA